MDIALLACQECLHLWGVGVAIFLFASGFGINESFKKNGLRRYWIKKTARVLFPYAIVVTALELWHNNHTLPSYLLDITGLVTSYWYIGFLIKAYITYWIFTKFFHRYRIQLLIVYSFVVLLSFPNIEAEQAFSFTLGVLVSVNFERITKLDSRQLIIIGSIGFVVGITFLAIKQLPWVRSYESKWLMNVVQCLIKMPIGIFVICATTLTPKVCANKILQFIGKISYELYLLQMPFYGMIAGSIIRAMIFLSCLFPASWVFQYFNSKAYNKIIKII